MTSNFLGGIWRRGPGARLRPGAPTPEAVGEEWGWIGERAELFLRGAPACARLWTWDGLALLLRGYARGGSGPLDLERVAEELRCHYLEHGTLAADGLEGSFTLALLDSHAERVVLYRNLVGSGSTYYFAGPDGLLFGGNLAELVDLAAARPAANEAALPAFFLYRCVPGRETLFRDFFRLMPGEEVSWGRKGPRREQRQTFSELRSSRVPVREALDAVEATMAAVLRDCAALRPEAANLLSGGVDSSYLQAVWNQHVAAPGDVPATWSISVDHPHTWPDSDYAMTASVALGTRHRLVPANGAYVDYLTEALAATGEPPNHVQSAYFGQLAQAMLAGGATAGLCGEGADSLFGLGTANQVHNARAMRRLVPFAPLRRLGGGVAAALGCAGLARAFRLANRIDDFSDLTHPVNQVAAFTDWPAVTRLFGEPAVAEAAAGRRRLLDRLAVPYEAMDRLHAAGFVGEAIDSAGHWAAQFNAAGADLLCPFLDSRVVRLALSLAPEARYPFRRPKGLLKQALARLAPAELATRSKLGFGQPIFEWLAPGGQLSEAVQALTVGDIIDPPTLESLARRPTWLLYSLVVYDTWRKLFIDRSLPRPRAEPDARPTPLQLGHD